MDSSHNNEGHVPRSHSDSRKVKMNKLESLQPTAFNQLALLPPDKKEAFEAFKDDCKDVDFLVSYILSEMGEDKWSLAAPRNAISGLGHGVAAVGAGVVGGIGSLFYEPIHGACEGVGGFGKGLCKGIGGLVVYPVVGVGTGIVQFGRGIANGPKSHKMRKQGFIWNSKKKIWESPVENLKAELDKHEQVAKFYQHALDCLIARSKNTTGDGSPQDVKDMSYYDMFSVLPNAPISEIKKNYFKLAKDSHPDKVSQLEVAAGRVGPEYRNEEGNLIVVEKAKTRFQEIGHAYNILVDPETRRQYDLHGPDGVQSKNDGSDAEFSLLFRLDELTPWIGIPKDELLDDLSLMERGTFEKDIFLTTGIKLSEFTRIMDKNLSKLNSIKIALELEKRSAPFIASLMAKDGSTSTSSELGWENELRSEIRVILNHRIGPALMSMIGWEYCNKAASHFGKSSFLGHKAKKANFQAFKKKIDTQGKVVKHGYKLLKMKGVKESIANENGDGLDLDPEAIDTLLEVMFQVHGVYALETVRKQFKWFFKESLSKEELDHRAHAIQKVGTIINEELDILKNNRTDDGKIDWINHLTEQHIKRSEQADKEAEERDSKVYGK